MITQCHRQETTVKTCTKCGVVKDLYDFHRHNGRHRSLGRDAQCKVCRAVYDLARNATPQRKANVRASIAKYEANNQKIVRAKWLLNSHVKLGKIIPLPCLCCGEKAEAHHPDYDQPLSVVWLCRRHHVETHNLVR